MTLNPILYKIALGERQGGILLLSMVLLSCDPGALAFTRLSCFGLSRIYTLLRPHESPWILFLL
jgi:hypothetical protein